ncbi:MAG: transcription elongation factor GreA [Mogibacterium sp.]|nr:transcription elongation factor GreA [Mogibacterium sp.]
MVANSNEMTREGYDALTKELEFLSVEKRQEISERLKEAISYGDISENSEYDAAKEAQAENEDRIKEIEAILRTAKVVEDVVEETEAGTVQTGRTVTVKDLVYDEMMTYKIVGNTEADPFNGKLSNTSLVGQHLIGTKAGDVVEFQVPEGTARYEIIEVIS